MKNFFFFKLFILHSFSIFVLLPMSIFQLCKTTKRSVHKQFCFEKRYTFNFINHLFLILEQTKDLVVRSRYLPNLFMIIIGQGLSRRLMMQIISFFQIQITEQNSCTTFMIHYSFANDLTCSS